MSLDTPGVYATAPMLRGVWGSALRSLDEEAYRDVFEGGGNGIKTPRYVIRPATPYAQEPDDSPAVDWLLFGDLARWEGVLRQAWQVAGERGLGRERLPFSIERWREYRPNGSLSGPNEQAGFGWALSEAEWPLSHDSPCRLRFRAPLRLLRQGALIQAPTLADLVVAATRRLEGLLSEADGLAVRQIRTDLVEAARHASSGSWRGQRLDLLRWSGRQRRELEIRGVSGELDLPSGPGPVGELLAAAQWLHLGKATTVGLGQLSVEALTEGAGRNEDGSPHAG